MIFQSRIIFLVIFLLTRVLSVAQETNVRYTYSAGAEYFTGFIVRHHEDMGHLIKGWPTGIRANFSRYSYGEKAWEQRYGYPTFTAFLGYYDLKNDDVLGKVVSLNLGLEFHLNDITSGKNDFQVFVGFGMSYFNNPYNSDTNNKNNVISNHMPMTMALRVSYYRHLSKNLRVGMALQLSHFSNGSRSVPNYGLNIANLNLGAKYIFSDAKPEYKTDQLGVNNFSKKSYLNFDFRFGITELRPIGSGPSPYYAISLFWNKQVGSKSILDAGIEGFANKAREKQIVLNQLLIEGSPDYRAVGIMFGHELLFNKLALVTQLGFYIYKPYQSNERIYSKIGLKYYFNDHVFGSLILKTHYSIAEVIEYGIGIRF